MKPRDSIWYWTKEDHERRAQEFFTTRPPYDKDDIERIARYIEECGGTVGGKSERESLGRELNWMAFAWLRQRQTHSKRENIRYGKKLRKAMNNAESLLKSLRTEDASRHAAAVERDLHGVAWFTFPQFGFRNASIHVLLLLYLHSLRDEEELVALSVTEHEIRKLREERWRVIQDRQTRFQKWLEGVAFLWEASNLRVDTSRVFSSFVRECLPTKERCMANSLEPPRPINERTVIDWVAKVRHSRERKL
jgi:hypothetical protein